MDSIARLRLKSSSLLHQLIRTHLSFIFDNNFDLESNQQKERKFENNSTIFGSNLTHEGICSVHQLIEFIAIENNITKEGLFRKSGNTLRQLKLRNLISSGKTVDLTANRFTVHDCCSVLKKFVSELPEPLLTETHFEVFKTISQIPSELLSPNKTQSKKLTAIQLLLLLIPAPNRQLLEELLALFEKVLQNYESNQMSSTNLAIIFAPILLCPQNFSAIELQLNLQSFTETLVFIIENFPVICRPPPKLIIDVDKQLEIMESAKNGSTSSLAVVNFAHQFCVRDPDPKADDYTAQQLAQLYAHLQSMPDSDMKKKSIKQFNRENGKGTPLLLKRRAECLRDSDECEDRSGSVTPLTDSINIGRKKMRLSVPKVGNREPILMSYRKQLDF